MGRTKSFSEFSKKWHYTVQLTLHFLWEEHMVRKNLWIFSKRALGYLGINFLLKVNMVQIKWFGFRFSQKGHYVIQYTVFLENNPWLKPSSEFLNILKKDIMLFGKHLIFSEKTKWFSRSSLFLNFFKNNIALLNSLFFEKTTWFKTSSLFLNFIKSNITLFTS